MAGISSSGEGEGGGLGRTDRPWFSLGVKERKGVLEFGSFLILRPWCFLGGGGGGQCGGCGLRAFPVASGCPCRQDVVPAKGAFMNGAGSLLTQQLARP